MPYNAFSGSHEGNGMSWIKRFSNVFNQRRLNREIEEEFASHIEEAIERGDSVEEARKIFGDVLRHREHSRDVRLLPWFDALASDIVFGWRQLRKRPAVSAAAILSLALAIGATTAAFRLINAVLLRTLPVADPQRLFIAATTYVDRDGRVDYSDDFDYPTFRRYCETVADRADLLVAGRVASRQAAVFGSGAEGERVYRQYVSGNLFPVFGLQPVLGRLLTPDDDRTPGEQPVAVLSYDFWTRRFGRDPGVLGSTFRMGKDTFTIIGVAPKGFIGTEPGSITDVFLPAMMNAEAINKPDWSWFRLFVRPKAGFSAELVRQPLQASFTREHQDQMKSFPADTPKPIIDTFLNEKLVLLPAASGASDVQRVYRRPLLILGALVILVLLVACTNVGNLLTAQATARAREMALRVSIGAGHWRLIQLVLVESALLAVSASVLGAFFASWCAPLVVDMLHVPEDPVRLVLDSGWRDLAFAAALASSVALLFGLAPAFRASHVEPMSTLRGGDDPHARRRLMYVLLAAQVAFCILVQFVAGLFVSTFQRLSNRPLGFSAERLLVMDANAPKEQPLQFWTQAADQLRGTPGVQSVALAAWPLLEGDRWTVSVRLPGHPVEVSSPYALDVSPGYFSTMRIGLIAGRDFRLADLPPRLDASNQPLPGVGIVNEAFARTYFDGQNPVGRSVYMLQSKDTSAPMEIIGYVRDTVYRDVREPMHATVYVPTVKRQHYTFMVRTTGDPLPVTPILRRAVSNARPDLRVSTIQPEANFLRWQMLRERLLATLSFFFAIIALVLAAIGLYGVLNYSVTWQQREIGIRIVLGAQPAHIVRRATSGLLAMVVVGLLAGLAAGIACGRLIESLLFEIKATDPGTVAIPLLTLLGAALAAILPPAIRAMRIDPAQTLRSE
jgi:putative ABC transport system permease protein